MQYSKDKNTKGKKDCKQNTLGIIDSTLRFFIIIICQSENYLYKACHVYFRIYYTELHNHSGADKEIFKNWKKYDASYEFCEPEGLNLISSRICTI